MVDEEYGCNLALLKKFPCEWDPTVSLKLVKWSSWSISITVTAADNIIDSNSNMIQEHSGPIDK